MYLQGKGCVWSGIHAKKEEEKRQPSTLMGVHSLRLWARKARKIPISTAVCTVEIAMKLPYLHFCLL